MKKIFFALLTFCLCMSCAACHADTRIAGLSWYQNISDDFAGWRVYMSNVSGQDYAFVPNAEEPESNLTLVYTDDMAEPYTLEVTIAVTVGMNYEVFFVVRALDLTGNESDPSNEVSKTYFIPVPTTSIPTTSTTIDDIPPEPPYDLQISQFFWQYETITLNWS